VSQDAGEGWLRITGQGRAPGRPELALALFVVLHAGQAVGTAGRAESAAENKRAVRPTVCWRIICKWQLRWKTIFAKKSYEFLKNFLCASYKLLAIQTFYEHFLYIKTFCELFEIQISLELIMNLFLWTFLFTNFLWASLKLLTQTSCQILTTDS
jgi:hypothetical protein